VEPSGSWLRFSGAPLPESPRLRRALSDFLLVAPTLRARNVAKARGAKELAIRNPLEARFSQCCRCKKIWETRILRDQLRRRPVGAVSRFSSFRLCSSLWHGSRTCGGTGNRFPFICDGFSRNPDSVCLITFPMFPDRRVMSTFRATLPPACRSQSVQARLKGLRGCQHRLGRILLHFDHWTRLGIVGISRCLLGR
jgi:hypothetical protein